ncbi:MAG: hypothetical protein JO306_14095 [Gemmatimonadetes bacterium]|nr:hypothetical protein [Gemmatimonadota bacterium]
MPHLRHAVPRAAALAMCAAALRAAPAAAQVQVSLRPLAPPEAVYVADFLPGTAPSRPDLIGITLVLTGASAPAGDVAASRAPATTGGGVTISLEIVVTRESPQPAEIFRGTTHPFVLDQPVRHITLRDLASRGRDVSLADYTVNDEVRNAAGGSGGRLMAGTYVFTAIVHGPRGEVIDQDELRLTFGSPTRVELLSPGAPADVAPPVVSQPTPRFLWSGDGASPGARYRLRVVKVDGTSPVEAVQSGFPSWDAIVEGTSALYPASVQALRLEPGATYAWQVVREVSTSGGVEVVESPIWWFRVGGAGEPGTNGGLDLRWAALLRALGLTELEGYHPVGATLEDGRPLSLQALESLLQAIQAGDVPVLSVRVR